jgi:hypothetical protein
MVEKKKPILLGVVSVIVFVILGAVLYFTPSNARNSSYVQDSFNGYNTGLTIQAWSDASYSFGSSNWMFLYEPSFGSSFEANFSFTFPYFPINPSVAQMLGGQPILISVLRTMGQSEMEGRLLNATAGASYTWDGLEIRVSEVNPAYVVLLFKPLS